MPSLGTATLTQPMARPELKTRAILRHDLGRLDPRDLRTSLLRLQGESNSSVEPARQRSSKVIARNVDIVAADSYDLLARLLVQAGREALSLPRDSESAYLRACAVAGRAISTYWQQVQHSYRRPWPIAPLPRGIASVRLSNTTAELADEVGVTAAKLHSLSAGYLLGELYTSLLPSGRRSDYGVFFTPPALARRLLVLAEQSGVDWRTATVLDPACGGGAFLAPVAQRIAGSFEGEKPRAILEQITQRVRGFELDPFSAWMSHVLLEAMLIETCRRARQRLPNVITICDALKADATPPLVDLVIGNPPYGRTALSDQLRSKYARSLYGHANAYTLFLDLAIRWTRPAGVIAFITPTGFLGGQYFRNLRTLLAREAPPTSIDFVQSRKGVFSDVLQETLLATYRRGERANLAHVSLLSVTTPETAQVGVVGTFQIPDPPTEPWLVPRDVSQMALIESLRRMPHRLRDYGYGVSTGPLVWNRHKAQLKDSNGDGSFPIVWAESVQSDGTFHYRAEKRNHAPFIKPHTRQGWLLTRTGCVIVQRTTALEQRRRLIAAELPTAFIRKFGAVVIENHLNMVRALNGSCAITPRTLAALLNTHTLDRVFRCISGSVAVSASELASLPLPPLEQLQQLEQMLHESATNDQIEHFVGTLYGYEAVNEAS